MTTGKSIVNPAEGWRNKTMAQKVIIVMRRGFVAGVYSPHAPVYRLTETIASDLKAELEQRVAGTLSDLLENDGNTSGNRPVSVSVKIALHDIREV